MTFRENYLKVIKNQTNLEDLYYMGPFFWPKLENSITETYFSWKGAEGSLIVMGSIVSLFVKKTVKNCQTF